MTPERYQQVGRIYHDAVELSPEERAAFLDRECGGDDALRHEVESLIEADEQTSPFMDEPALAIAAGLLAGARRDSLVGQTVGHYRVLSLVGEGGMGEVYLAEDTSLGRRVALKLLPSAYTNDKDRMRRFKQEACAASALNHPNILTVYEIGRTDNTDYIATEFIDGETLRASLQANRIKMERAIDIAAQVAEALSAAHAAGVVHRDIKPENIMVRPDRYVKVLDFGLAKLARQWPAVESEALTATKVETNPGVVMGTVQYMSPEQARGIQVDARADIWSLGVVLYEMVAARAPFDGATRSDTMVSILEREPAPLAQHAPGTPAELERIVTKALTKNADERYQTVKDMAIDLRRLVRRIEIDAELDRSSQPRGDEQAAMTSNEAVVSSPLEQRITQANQSGSFAATSSLEFVVTQLRRHKASVGLVGVLVIVALASVLFGLYKFFRRSQIASPNVPLKVGLLTSLRGIERSVAFSPDGRQIAFVWKSEFANFDVYIKLIGAGEPLRLTTNPAREMSPAWSPDGRYIAFLRATGEDKGYYLIPALGGAERKLTNAYGRTQRGVMSQAVAWSPDGRTLALVDKAAENEPWCIYLLSVETGERRRFTTPPTQTDGDTTVAFSPDGRKLGFVRSHRLVGDIYNAPGEIYLAPIAGGDPVRLTSDGATIHGLAWTPDGAELVFSSERGGSRSLPTLWRIPAAGGTPVPVMGRLGDGVYDPSISVQGNQLAFAQQSVDINIYRVELTGQPGGRRKAGTPTSVISSTQADSGPRFSPDGRKIAFVSNRSGGINLWVCEADGKNQAQLTDSLDASGPGWSPDGRIITFDSVVGGNADIYAVSAEGGVVRRLTTEPSAETTPSWSPDGSWIYFGSNRTGRTEVWKIPAAGGAAVQLTHGGGFNPIAAPDGRTVYYLRDERGPWLWAASTEGGGETRLLEADPEKWIEPANWAVVGGGIYFLERKPGEPYTLQFFDFETRRATPLMTLGGSGDPFAMAGLTVAPDQRSMLYAQRDVLEFDLMLIENFK